MTKKMKFSLLALVLTLVLTVTGAALAGSSEKNYGVPVGERAERALRAADSSPMNPYSAGDRVRAVVDYPSASDCIRAGDTGTIVCYDSGDPNLPYLVDWDSNCGFPQSQVCGVEATNGWWVGFSEVELLSGGGTSPSGGCAYFDVNTLELVVSDVEITSPFAGTTYWDVTLQLQPMTSPFDPVLFQLTNIQQSTGP